MKKLLKVSLVASGLLSLLMVVVSRRINAGVAFERGLVFSTVDDQELRLDLLMPKAGDGPLPAVIFLHGKGERAGDRHEMEHFAKEAARKGYVGIASDYRLVPSARFPAQVHDCKAVVRWLNTNAQKYRIDPDRIGVVGFSAGGHLACMLGVTADSDWTDDDLVPIDQSKRLAEKLKNVGVTVDLDVLEGEGHGFSDANNQACVQGMFDFLDRELKSRNRTENEIANAHGYEIHLRTPADPLLCFDRDSPTGHDAC